MNNQRYRSIVMIGLGVLLFCACHGNKRPQTENVLSQFMGREIQFNGLIPFNLPEGVTLSSLLENYSNIIVFYVDSSSCEDCGMYNALNFKRYELDLKQKQRDDIQFIYIFNTQDIGALQKRLHDFGFNRHYFVDFENTFLSNNQIPRDKRFHTFLLKDNKVRIVGNPLLNKKVKNLYDKVLKTDPAKH